MSCFLKVLSRMLCLAVILPATAAAITPHGVSIGGAVGTDSTNAYRIGAQWLWPKTWCNDCMFKVGGYVEASVSHLDGDTGSNPNNNDSLQAIAVAPVLRFYNRWFNHRQYIEGGIGVSYLSSTRLGDRSFSLHGQFEDRIGIGILLGENKQYDLNLRFIHFSNGVLGSKNSGINLFYLNLGYWFNL